MIYFYILMEEFVSGFQYKILSEDLNFYLREEPREINT